MKTDVVTCDNYYLCKIFCISVEYNLYNTVYIYIYILSFNYKQTNN